MVALAEFCNPERLVEAIPCLAAALTETMCAPASGAGATGGPVVACTPDTLRNALVANRRLRMAIGALFKPVIVSARDAPGGGVCVCVCVCVCGGGLSCAGVQLADGERLFDSGDSGDCAYVVARGELSCVLFNEEGVACVVATFGAGACVGESCLARPAPRAYRVCGPLRADALTRHGGCRALGRCNRCRCAPAHYLSLAVRRAGSARAGGVAHVGGVRGPTLG